jgi:hypothetical protein
MILYGTPLFIYGISFLLFRGSGDAGSVSGMTGRRKTAKMVTDGLLTSVPVFQDRDFLENHRVGEGRSPG